MAFRTTRWTPDTCGCIFEYEWDDALDENARIHTFKKAVSLCEHHSLMLAPYDEVLKENTKKNKIYGLAKKVNPNLGVDDFTWSFDKNRKLTVGFLGKLTADQKKQLKDFADAEFGIGEVEVV